MPWLYLEHSKSRFSAVVTKYSLVPRPPCLLVMISICIGNLTIHRSKGMASYDSFHVAWVHFHRARVGACVQLVQLCAKCRQGSATLSPYYCCKLLLSKWKVCCTAASWLRVCLIEVVGHFIHICKRSLKQPGEGEAFEWDHHENWRTCSFVSSPVSVRIRRGKAWKIASRAMM